MKQKPQQQCVENQLLLGKQLRRTITAKGESKMEENPFQPLLRYIISHSFSKVKYFLSNYTNFYRFFQKIAFFISVYYRWKKDWLLLEEKLPFFQYQSFLFLSLLSHLFFTINLVPFRYLFTFASNSNK